MKKCPNCGIDRPESRFLANQCDRCDQLAVDLIQDMDAVRK
jgi:hypothetical protein